MTSRQMGGFSLVQLLLAVTALLSLAFVLPAFAAVRVNQSRVARAERDVRAIAEAIQRLERLGGDDVDLLVGPGEAPKVGEAAGTGWNSIRVAALSSHYVGMRPTPDPWGNRYTVLVGSAVAWVLSAGPNGVVETSSLPSAGHASLIVSGDDVGVVLGVGR